MIDDFLDILDEDEFEEYPVDLKTFITSPDYMDQKNLSDAQYQYVELATNIYRPETLYKIFSATDADKLSKQQVNELILLWGKGSGKNYSTTLALARIVYLLLCLKDPASYYGKPPGDAIDVLNVAVNSDQAKNTFFNPFKKMIQRAPWFEGRYDAGKAGEIRFDKNITCYSGHSEREAWEGYNFIAVVLDEIAAFKTDSETSKSNSDRVNSASALHKMYKQSVHSRFDEVGKLILISFSRFKGDFISTRYDEVIADKVVEKRTHHFKLHDDLPDNTPGNEFDIEWEVDHITAYRLPKVFAHKAASWEVNPTRDVESYKIPFYDDPIDSLTRYAGMPPDSIDAFFKDRERVEYAFRTVRRPFNDDWSFAEDFKPKSEDTNYYVHVDLAEKSDRAAVAMSHVSGWTKTAVGTPYESIQPIIQVDAVRWWTPKSNQNVEFGDVREYILSLRRRGFNLSYVTFDRWAGSIGLQNELSSMGINVETLSVQKNEYNELSLLINEQRLEGYQIVDEHGNRLLINELLGLRIRPGGKVDHTRSGSNDLADAVAGSVFLASKHEKHAGEATVEVIYPDELLAPRLRPPPNQGLIVPPMPREVADWVEGMQAI